MSLLRLPLLLLFLLLLSPLPTTAKRKRKKKKKRAKLPTNKPTIILTSPSNNDTTTSTKISFVVHNPLLSTHLQVEFKLNGNLIKLFDDTTYFATKRKEISMDITNMPRGVQHVIAVMLMEKNRQISSDARHTWLIDDWREISMTGGRTTATACDSTLSITTTENTENTSSCQPSSNNFAAPFHTSVANIFSSQELQQLRNFTISQRHLYSPTTVGEIEHVDGEYRRTKKLIVRRSPSVEWIYARLEKVARTINQMYWRFHLPPASSSSSSSSASSPAAAAASPVGDRYNNDGCRLHESLQLLLYESKENGFYDWHLDRGVSGSSSKRKLSMTVQLTNFHEYEGGVLNIQSGRDVVAMPGLAGSATLFPSYILHQVTPVKRGAREAIVLWFTGCEGYT